MCSSSTWDQFIAYHHLHTANRDLNESCFESNHDELRIDNLVFSVQYVGIFADFFLKVRFDINNVYIIILINVILINLLSKRCKTHTCLRVRKTTFVNQFCVIFTTISCLSSHSHSISLIHTTIKNRLQQKCVCVFVDDVWIE